MGRVAEAEPRRGRREAGRVERQGRKSGVARLFCTESKSLDLPGLRECRRGNDMVLRICDPEERAKRWVVGSCRRSAISESGSADFGMARLGSTGYGLVI